MQFSSEGFLFVRIPTALMNLSSSSSPSNSTYVVSVDGLNVNANKTFANEHFQELKIPTMQNSKAIRISGTEMVPEFSTTMILFAGLAIMSIVIVGRYFIKK